jgi:ATP-dependent DNA ligase
VINERQIAGNPTASLRDDWRGQCMKHHADFDALTAVLQLENTQYRLVEPSLLAEIEYRAKSAEGKVRHPFFKGLREDL